MAPSFVLVTDGSVTGGAVDKRNSYTKTQIQYKSNIFIKPKGGYNISIEEAPHHVSYGDICGGVLLHHQWALTSAHCGSDSTYIRAGHHHRLKGPKIKIITHLIHPRYSKLHEFDFDVQLLRTIRRLHFNRKVSPIKITGRYSNSMTLTGWGYGREKGDYNNFLQQVKLNVISLEECQEVDKFWYNHTLTDRMFCAGGDGKDACQGDSGGGAVSKGKLLGISSFGFGCGRNIPGVYVDLTQTNIRGWIYRYTGA